MSEKGNNSLLDAPLVFVDIETNGLNHIRGRIIEVAAIRVEQGKIVKKFSSLIDPETELPQFITNLTGITTNDVRQAPIFGQIIDELDEVLAGAIFVAHNVRFDYSFIKQEYKRLGRSFLPKQLCTVKLSRSLFPEHRTHKLQDLIDRYQFTYQARHRAYDDAHVLWQFLQYLHKNVAVEIIDQAVAKQIRQPAIPKEIDTELVRDLPTGPGVYIFEDEFGRALYIGKSINIKKRVLQHFGQDHSDSREFKIAQTVKHISTHQTDGELSALLLESRLIKEMQPVYNRMLRRVNKMMVARHAYDDNGYIQVWLEEAHMEELTEHDILAAYPRRGRAKESFDEMVKLHSLCPKLMGLEKSKGSCFAYQLHKCRGACIGDEPVDDYNQRLIGAFERRRIQAWPYKGPILVQEANDNPEMSSGIIIDQWCVVAQVHQEADYEPQVVKRAKSFDLDTYKILQSFIATKASKLSIKRLSNAQLTQLLSQ